MHPRETRIFAATSISQGEMGDYVRGHMRHIVLPETLALATLCFLDMIWTITAVHLGIAKEGNPIMAAVISQSTVLFAFVKIISFMMPLTILELIRHRSPVFIARALRFALVAYVGVYLAGSLHVHGLI